MADPVIGQKAAMWHGGGGGGPGCGGHDRVISAVDHKPRTGHRGVSGAQIDICPEKRPAHMGRAKHVGPHHRAIERAGEGFCSAGIDETRRGMQAAVQILGIKIAVKPG